MALNRVLLCGRLGKDPELRRLPDGKPVTNFTLATSERRKDGSELTEWHSIVVWGNRAESCAKYLYKGRQVFIEGRLRTRSWEKDGRTNYRTDVIASNVEFLGPNKQHEDAATTQQSTTPPNYNPPNYAPPTVPTPSYTPPPPPSPPTVKSYEEKGPLTEDEIPF